MADRYEFLRDKTKPDVFRGLAGGLAEAAGGGISHGLPWREGTPGARTTSGGERHAVAGRRVIAEVRLA
jgi:hypothetical protein